MAFQGSQGGGQRGNLALGVGLLLALHGHDGLGRIGHKALVGQLLLYAGQEALGVLQFTLEFLNLGGHVDVVAQRHS